MNTDKQQAHLYWSIYIVFFIVLVSIWGSFIYIIKIERNVTLERVENQLKIVASTLADLNYLADKTKNLNDRNTESKDAIWHALLLYPKVNIWVESQGVISAGQPTLNNLDNFVIAKETKGRFTVHVALPIKNALIEWYHNVWKDGIALSIITLVFIIISVVLSRTLQQRAIAEGKTKEAYVILEKELIERKIAQEILRKHDELLNAITKSATYLLGTQDYEEAIAIVLELIANALNVSRIHLSSFTSNNTSFQSELRYESYAPNFPKMINNEEFTKLDLACQLYKMIFVERPDSAKVASLYIDDLPDSYKKPLEEMQMRSFLYIPVLVNNTLWGSLVFIDCSFEKREWTWAETDALVMLESLISASILRIHFIEELTIANRRSGMAEVATSIIHNIGNVLNSVKVSTNELIENFNNNPYLNNLNKISTMLKNNLTHMSDYIANDPKGKVIPEYIMLLSEQLNINNQKMKDETFSLLEHIRHIEDIVSMQMSISGASGIAEKISVNTVIDNAIKICMASLEKNKIKIIKEYLFNPTLKTDKTKLMQILINLITNATDALMIKDYNIPEKKITIKVEIPEIDKPTINIYVTDNGIGITQENLKKNIFTGIHNKKNRSWIWFT